ncbi:sequence-specific DNA binding transcription factors [Euphorbia peplus]|nr:sequence-specific DNA binding transcription factors [Euphorbia peplus]
MEGNLSGGMPPFGGLDLHGSNRVVHHQGQYPHTTIPQHPHPIHRQSSSSIHPSVRDGFPLTMATMNTSDQPMYNKGDKGKNSASDEDEPSYTEDGFDGHNEGSRGKKGSPWQRVKWTDKMVKLLITAVSYIGEDMSSDCDGGGMRRKFAVLQKKGKWKLVSKVMAERAFHVSPQQCEDKFNDLNKRYKRLNDMLGRGTSCQVVENPTLLDVIDYLSEKEKDDVRKILSSKHLFYEEMCSYHNGNRLHLPHDPALQRSLQLALRSKDDHDIDDMRKHQPDDLDEDDQEGETDDHDEFEENTSIRGDNRGLYGSVGSSIKRFRHGEAHQDACFGNSSLEGNKCSYSHQPISQVDMNQMSSESTRAAWTQKQWMESRTLQLEEQKLQIQLEMLELEKQRFKWKRFSRKRDHELEKLRMENERMKLENERMAMELKRKEMGVDFS